MTNDKQCCFDRKIVVLRNAVRGKHAWMSGIRKDQTQDRAQSSVVHWDKKFNLVKISPLANWTKTDVWKRILDEDIPYNPLHDQGYPQHRLLAVHAGGGCGRNRRARRPLERQRQDRMRPALARATRRQRHLN